MFKIPYTKKTEKGGIEIKHIDLKVISTIYNSKVPKEKRVKQRDFKKSFNNALFEMYKFAAIHKVKIRLPRNVGYLLVQQNNVLESGYSQYLDMAAIPFDYAAMHKQKKISTENDIKLDLFDHKHYTWWRFKHKKGNLKFFRRYFLKLAGGRKRIAKLLVENKVSEIDNLPATKVTSPEHMEKMRIGLIKKKNDNEIHKQQGNNC